MIGATISRWTMSYFATALVFLVIGEVLTILGFGFPSHELRAPETLFLVHTFAIGWLSFLMIGALFQFVPVLVARPIWSDKAALPAFLLLLVGLIGLLAGFYGLAGYWVLPSWLLPVASIVLAAGFALAISVLSITIFEARPLALPTRFVAVGFASVILVVCLGITFALSFSVGITNEVFLNIAGSATSLHATLGLVGWLSFTAIGVSYRLFTMFLLAPDEDRPISRAIWWLGAAALTILSLGIVLLAGGYLKPVNFLIASFIPGLVAIGLYICDMNSIYRKRKRKVLELNSWASVPALGALIGAICLAASLPFTAETDAAIAALVYLFALGWLSGLSLAQLYKIVPFLTWLECYGPVMGRAPTPRVQDIVREKSARPLFYVFHAGVWVATLGLYFDHGEWFRVGNALNLAAIVALVVHLWRARRLSNIPMEKRMPNGIVLPHLFYSDHAPVGRIK